MQHLSATLESLHQSAEALAAQEPAAKRPRIEEVNEPSDVAMRSERARGKAMEPFGGASYLYCTGSSVVSMIDE